MKTTPISDGAVKSGLGARGIVGALAVVGVILAGLEGMVLGTYVDDVGVITSCFGHTGSDIKQNQKFTQDQCLDQFAKDLGKYNDSMDRVIGLNAKRLNKNQRTGLLLFHYNHGISERGSPTMLGLLRSGKFPEACHQIPRFRYAGKCNQGERYCEKTPSGKYKLVLPGILKARERAMKICLTPVQPESATIKPVGQEG